MRSRTTERGKSRNSSRFEITIASRRLFAKKRFREIARYVFVFSRARELRVRDVEARAGIVILIVLINERRDGFFFLLNALTENRLLPGELILFLTIFFLTHKIKYILQILFCVR